MAKAIRVIRIGERDVALFGLSYAFPQAVLMQRDRIGISQVELIGIQAIDQDRTTYPPLFSVDEDSHELCLLPLLGDGQFALRAMVLNAIVNCSAATQLA
ncbi:hypothetical protein D3872_24005 [Massilia cavernae]|uniref:Uncharacterized protein n=1 Tax=Massilia cavernae TaxID=2320864 RepID=A0A418X7F5_9BURK|nr:hypothetical protein D3872_24005 [Massilia cavernae]